MIGHDYYERLACAYCGSEFDDHWTEDYKYLEEARCPVCKEHGHLFHKFEEQCAVCGATLGLTDLEASDFKASHSDGDCCSIYDENYYLKDGKFYCQECWDKLSNTND